MSAADLVTRLAQAGIDPTLLAEVAEELFSGEIERKALAGRKENERERAVRRRGYGGGEIPPELRRQVFERDDYICQDCGAEENLQCDHVHPVSKGGPTTLENLQVLCRPCNARKKDRVRKADVRETSKEVRRQSRNSADTVSPIEELPTPSGTELPNEASASLPIRQPISEARDCWNENAGQAGWPTINVMSAGRQKSLSCRLRQHGISGWRAAIARARSSPYLAGPDPPSWFTFDWLSKAGNFLKVTEGNYDRQQRTNGMGRDQSDGLSPTTRAALKVFGPPGSGQQRRVPQ